jgi:hypothetical protein
MKIQKHSDEAIAQAVQVLREHFMWLAGQNGSTCYLPRVRINDTEFEAIYHETWLDPDVSDPPWDETGRYLADLRVRDVSKAVR